MWYKSVQDSATHFYFFTFLPFNSNHLLVVNIFSLFLVYIIYFLSKNSNINRDPSLLRYFVQIPIPTAPLFLPLPVAFAPVLPAAALVPLWFQPLRLSAPSESLRSSVVPFQSLRSFARPRRCIIPPVPAAVSVCVAPPGGLLRPSSRCSTRHRGCFSPLRRWSQPLPFSFTVVTVTAAHLHVFYSFIDLFCI